MLTLRASFLTAFSFWDSLTDLSNSENFSWIGFRSSEMDSALCLRKALLFSAESALKASFMFSRSFSCCSFCAWRAASFSARRNSSYSFLAFRVLSRAVFSLLSLITSCLSASASPARRPFSSEKLSSCLLMREADLNMLIARAARAAMETVSRTAVMTG